MDFRTALKEKAKLKFVNKDSGEQYFIVTKELGRGATCIVYEAYCESNTGDKIFYRIKECYPHNLHIKRSNDGGLVVADNEAEQFREELDNFEKNFSLSNDVFYKNQMHIHMANQLDLYNYNNTKYIVTTYSTENTLAKYKPKDIKECINIVKKVAFALSNIHKQGYLFLDIKPSNILVIEDLEKQIKLLDFDSIVSFKDIEEAVNSSNHKVRFSFSKGFAPIELESGNIKRLDVKTDVFEIGALLFWLLFRRIPSALDCESDANYSFDEINFNFDNCDSKLFTCLTRFFNMALSSFYLDRFSTMDEVVEELENIEKLADPKIPRIISSVISCPKFVYGRLNELKRIDDFVKNKQENCLYITGMGGIGKSTLVQKYLCEHKNDFDVLLYINFFESTEKTICNDQNIQITTLSSVDYDGGDQSYFYIKLQKIKELLNDTNSILAIDNFSGDIDKYMLQVMQIGCKVILISRDNLKSVNFTILHVDSISDFDSLNKIFRSNLGRLISENEKNLLQKLYKVIEGHTLLIELIAKQISYSHMSLEEAIEIVEVSGASNIGSEKINYEKDGITSKNTIGNIIEALFEADRLSKVMKTILKVASLLGSSGVYIHMLKEVMDIDSFDDFNELYESGWLNIEDKIVTMHPVIQECIRQWNWDETSISKAGELLEYFRNLIMFEATRNNFSTSYLKQDPESDADDFERPIDFNVLEYFVNLAEEILTNCGQEKEIQELDKYIDLFCTVALYLPRSTEDYIISFAQELIKSNRVNNPIMLMRLYRRIVEASLEMGDKETAIQSISDAKRLANIEKDNKIRTLFYDMEVEYYDVCLDGAYDTKIIEEEKLLKKLMSSIDKTILYSKKYLEDDTDHLYAKALLAKATILIRSGLGSQKEVSTLLKVAKEYIEKYTFKYADVRLTYYLVLAWYNSLILEDKQLTDEAIEHAIELSKVVLRSDLDIIDCVIVPCANIYFELQCFEKSLEILQEGIDICKKHPKIEIYDKKAQDLNEHYEEVSSEIR